MKFWHVGLVLMIVAVGVMGCSELGEPATPTPAALGSDWGYTSAYLDTSYAEALPVMSQLMLGTFKLEETEDAVTPAQATTLLPLWQAFQGNTLRDNEERSAVLAQIEKAMTPEQLQAIAAMQLTRSDWQTWAESQGVSLAPGGDQGPSTDARATRQAQFGNLTEAEREAMKATAQAGGGFAGSGQGGGQGRKMGGGATSAMLDPLIELLTKRAAE